MATYATQTDFEAYSEGWVTTDPAALERYLVRAEGDVDSILGYHGDLSAAGRKVDPTLLTQFERDVLRDATCAQCEYRLSMGDAFFIRDQHQSVSGPQFSHQGTLQRIGPKTFAELNRAPSLRNAWGTASA